MTKEELEQIEAHANAMSNGRWEYSHNGMMEPPSVYIDGKESIVVYSSDDDAKSIAHARTDIPALIAEIRRLHKVIAKELSENDELGAEYTYVRALKDENARLMAELKRIESLKNIYMNGGQYGLGASDAYRHASDIAHKALEGEEDEG